jgi:proline iminopeptidase
MRLGWLGPLLLALSTSGAHAQPAPNPIAWFAGPSGRSTIPLQRSADNKLYLTVMVKGQPLNLFIDTGGMTLLHADVARRLGLPLTDTEDAAFGITGVAGMRQLALVDLVLGKTVITNYQVSALDLSSAREMHAAKGMPVFDGLIGADLLAVLRARIDFDRMVLEVRRPDQATLDRLHITPPPASSTPAQRESLSVPVREGFAVTPDGVRLFYRVVGTGEETVIAPFALYHGAALDSLAEGRRVVTYDPRGRGRSQAVSLDRVSLDFLLSDLETVRQEVGAEKIAIIGWSGAGMETFVYALRHPERVTRLVQLAPVAARAQPYSEEMNADRERRTDRAASVALQERIAAGEFAGRAAEQCRADNAIFVPSLVAHPASAALIPDVCDSQNEQPAALGEYFGALWPTISSYDWRDSLAEVTVPRLVIYPLQDNITRAGVEEWVRDQANARILYIEDSGHFPQYEQPALTMEAIGQFLDGSWPEQAARLTGD